MRFYFDSEVAATLVKLSTGDYEVGTARTRRKFSNTDAAVREINIAIEGDMGAMVAIDAEALADLVPGINIS